VILADTSVWIEHLRHGEPGLRAALEAERVLMHPFVIGELACGNLRERDSLLELLRRLPVVPMATEQEAHSLLTRRHLMGRGIGWIDVHLLASTALAGPARFWTRDKRLATIAADLKLAVTGTPWT
jgi:predicted nucleic acid-binding protein